MRPTTPLLVLLLGATLLLAAVQPPPAPTRAVTDEAHFLTPATRDALSAKLEALEGAQVVVWVGALPDGATIEDWSAKTFAAWGLGRKGKDDGVALFVFPAQRTLRIEVGYGLEGVLTDAAADRILRERFAPRARAGDGDGAVTAAVDGIVSTLGLTSATAPPVEAPPPLPFWQRVLGVVAALALLVLFITHPRLAFFLLLNIVGHGHAGGSRRGFGGGGGRSGGGGATGTW